MKKAKHLREDCEGEGTSIFYVGLHLQTPVLISMDSHRWLNLHVFFTTLLLFLGSILFVDT